MIDLDKDFTKEELDELERELYNDEEWEELQAMKAANPGGINYLRRPCIYKELGVPDPVGSLCRDCR